MNDFSNKHFLGASPSRHIVEKFSRGAAFASEKHGVEISGSKSALIDSLRSTGMILAILGTTLNSYFGTVAPKTILVFSLGIVLWQAARSGSLGWFRLQRLHKEMLEERQEITNSRAQERAELEALYALKGFEPPLLDRVVEVLMADDDRLLRVMLEEELGLPLGICDHPMIQGLGSLAGAFIAGAVFFFALNFANLMIAVLASAFLIAAVFAKAAQIEGSAPLEAFIWNFNLLCALTGLVHVAGKWITAF